MMFTMKNLSGDVFYELIGELSCSREEALLSKWRTFNDHVETLLSLDNSHVGILLRDGDWIDNPDRVKKEFYNHFANKFSAPDWSRVPMEGIFPRRLRADSSPDLEGDISNDEKNDSLRLWV
ncbi:hypothetical protein Tco_1021410 [Tanacetum coccineum]